MTFTTLPTVVQDMMLESYYVWGKSFILFFIFSVSVVYLFFFKKLEKKTPYFTIGAARILLVNFSVANICFAPYFVFMLNPHYDFYNFLLVWLTVHGIGIFVFVSMLVVDVVSTTPYFILKLGGFDIENRRVNEVFRRVFKKHDFY